MSLRRTLLVLCLGLLAGSDAPGTAAPAAPSVVSLSSLETVRTRGTPGGAREARLEAARGEWESFQVVVHAGARPIAALSMRGEPLVGPRGARIEPRLARVGFVEVKVPSNVEGAVGPWPDPLIPDVDAFTGEHRNAFPVKLAAGLDAAAWVDVFVPRDAPSGLYRGAISVFDGDVPIGRVPVELTVHRFALPATSSLPVTFGFAAATAMRGHFGRAVEDPTGERARRLTRLYSLAALRDRVSLHGGTFDPAPFTVDAAGHLRIDFRPYDDEVGPFLDGTADPGGPARGARFSAIDLRAPARLDGPRRAEYLLALADHLAARGWLDRVFDYTADEPPDATLPAVRARAESLHAVAPRIPRLVTRSFCSALEGAVDIWCPVVNLVDDKPAGDPTLTHVDRAGYDARLARGERLWWYQSCLSTGCDVSGGRYASGWPALVVDAPPVAHRILEWLSYRYRVGGELYYDTVEAYDGDPWRDLRRHGGNGDGTLFYPGRPDVIGGTSDIPIESIRLKRIRDGLEDYEYLVLYARLAGKEAAFALARRIASRTFEWDHDPRHLLAARAEIARALDAAP